MKSLIGSLVVVFACAAGVRGEEAQKPDFASYDQPVLVILAENQYHEIQRLRAEIEELKAQIAAGHGGAVASLDGGIVGIEEGSWVVTVQSVETQDISHLEAEMARIRAGMPALDTRLTQARANLQRVTAKGPYDKSSKTYGYHPRELSTAQTSVSKIEREKKRSENKLRDLDRRITVERSTVIAQGTTDDGVPVTITAKGANAHAGSSLVEGGTYSLTGRGQFGPNSGKITLKTAVEQREEVAVE